MRHDITIVGGGMVGLTLAALLVKNNFGVNIIEEKPFGEKNDGDEFLSEIPRSHARQQVTSARVSAIHATSAKLFRHLELFSLFDNAAPLCEMKIWDHTQKAHLHFNSDDIHQMQMGYIIENRAIIKNLYEKLMQDNRATFFCPAKPDDFQFAFKKNNVIVGADGANSWVRKKMPVTLQTRAYQQKSIIAVIETTLPHNNIAYQKFLKTGPVALLPLKNKNHTALVWSADDPVSDELMQQSESDFSNALTQALDFKCGKLKIISKRAQFPLIMRHVDNYVAENFALIGDAAHTIHPLAGLGVNLGLMDAACLAQVLMDARERKKNIGELRTLRRYARWRMADNTAVIALMRGLQEIFAIDQAIFNGMRSVGVNALNQCETLKNLVMRAAMGQSKDLPSFLQT